MLRFHSLCALRASVVVFLLLLTGAHAAAPVLKTNEWRFLDNGQVRLGVKLSSGAAIGWFSTSGSETNLLNHYDHGRLIQQSYYGDSDGSVWGKQPWRWNPVQGGGYRGEAARVAELRVERDSLYARTVPRHWATGAELPEVTMEQWISLTGAVAHIRFRMAYTGAVAHARRPHELPAVFVEPQFDTLVLYDGDKPWTGAPLHRSRPGWPNESRRMTERWAAYVNANGVGVGVFVPVTDSITCYRYGQPGGKDACSYFAPVKSFAITNGISFDYDVAIATGTVEEMRAAFSRLRK